jgi:protease I
MEPNLKGKRIAILATDGVEQVELERPRKSLDDAGAVTILVAPNDTTIQAFRHYEQGDRMRIDAKLEAVGPDEFDALMLPGGALNPDRLRTIPDAVEFVRGFSRGGKPIAAICHAPWMLVEADIVRGRRVTSWPSLKTDLRNAGARWLDEEVVVDGRLVTSRKPDDIPAFSREMIAAFSKRT